MAGLFDSPMVSQVAFHPTTFPEGTGIGPNQTDGKIDVTRAFLLLLLLNTVSRWLMASRSLTGFITEHPKPSMWFSISTQMQKHALM